MTSTIYPFTLHYYPKNESKKEVEKFRDLTPKEKKLETRLKVGMVIASFICFIGTITPTAVGLGVGLGLGLNGIISHTGMLMTILQCSITGSMLTLFIQFLPGIVLLDWGLCFDLEGFNHGWGKRGYFWKKITEEEAQHLYNDSLKEFSQFLKDSNLAAFYRNHLLSKKEYFAIKLKVERYRAITECQRKLTMPSLSQTLNSLPIVRDLHDNQLRTKTSLENCENRIKRMEEKWTKKRNLFHMFTGVEIKS